CRKVSRARGRRPGKQLLEREGPAGGDVRGKDFAEQLHQRRAPVRLAEQAIESEIVLLRHVLAARVSRESLSDPREPVPEKVQREVADGGQERVAEAEPLARAG